MIHGPLSYVIFQESAVKFFTKIAIYRSMKRILAAKSSLPLDFGTISPLMRDLGATAGSGHCMANSFLIALHYT